MVERKAALDLLTHSVLIGGVMLVGFPLYLALVASSHSPQELAQAPIPMWFGDQLWQSYTQAIFGNSQSSTEGAAARMLWVSFFIALVITVGKISISLMSAFGLVYFRFPLRRLCFWMIFITLMLPVEVRVGPTYQVIADLHMVNTFAGMAVPLIASATATFLFRQFFMTVPDELVEAARMDGAGPLQFFWDILLPLSTTSIAALFVIQFTYGWNQYLWPLIVATNEDMYPITVGLRRMFGGADSPPQWNVVMATALLATLPPTLVVVCMQKWFIRGLVDGDK
jgi:sn-glycerol 3-phosphate transport system permease protein